MCGVSIRTNMSTKINYIYVYALTSPQLKKAIRKIENKIEDGWGVVGEAPTVKLDRTQAKLRDVWGDAKDEKYISERKVKQLYERNKKRKSAFPLVSKGTSYNPSAGEHAEALMELAGIQRRRKQKVDDKKRIQNEINGRTSLKAMKKAGNVQTPEEPENDEHDDSLPDKVHFPQTNERKTTAQRNKEKLLKREQGIRLTEVKEKKLLAEVTDVKKFSKELVKEAKVREDNLKVKKDMKRKREDRTRVRVNGRDINPEDFMGAIPLPEVLPPSQLPDKMSTIPGMGGVIESEFLRLQSQGVVETGKHQLRGQKKKPKRVRIRNKTKFDLETAKSRIAQPRFKMPEKIALYEAERKAKEGPVFGKNKKKR